MSNQLIQKLKEFLRNSDLSSYEINTYMTLLISNNLTAREVSEKSHVPIGRVYEILEGLKEKGMIETQDSRPKIYRAKSFNLAFKNLISYINSLTKRKVSYLIDQAKILESDLYNSSLFIKKDPSRVFWQTTYGLNSIITMYVKYYNELQEELLVNDFINENTIKVLPFGRKLFEGIINALNRGVNVKILWSFEHDTRPLSDERKKRNLELYGEVLDKLEELYNLSNKIERLEMRFINKRIPTNYDIFDKKRVFIKLQNPLKPSQIFACMNVLDPNLAENLREKFNQTWLFEANKRIK
ncbi:MAG: TrmB family transcriptional regulator [Promethearchaeota archaeon]|nr:MAG: TrmB family transcriptional regulator [Candidatus Lokiarchaeota archaeon]